MEKNSILSLHLAPNLHERMKKKSILSLHLAPNLCERMEKNIQPLTEYHRCFMLLVLPVAVVVVLFVAF
jgi:hypothetical protein